MRIVISSPDGIGDFVLREPLWAELVAQGHDLLFLVRAPTCDAAETIVPTAMVWEIPADPYDHEPRGNSPRMAALAARLQAFRAELLVVAPFVHTWFDNWLADVLPSVTAVGFAGRMYPAGVASLAAPLISRFTRTVDIPIDVPELVKNRALAAAVLERDLAWRAPRLSASPAVQRQMCAKLNEHGWQEGPFHVACVGEGSRNRHINWPIERWVELLRHARKRHGWRFVLIGDAAERASNRAIAEAVGAEPFDLICLDDPLLEFAEVVALVSLAAGYVGRDSGPMHIAAALGKPVLSVFAGGCWPRFVPAANAGKAFAMSVPCAGCGNFCHLPECYCIRELPLAPVVVGLDAIARSPRVDFTAHVLPRPMGLAERMEREAAIAGRERAWQLVQHPLPMPEPVVYGRGWHPLESMGDSTFRWMEHVAVAELRYDGPLPQRLCCIVDHVIHPQSRASLRLRVEGQDVPLVWNEHDQRSWSATIPEEIVGFNDHVRIELSSAAYRPCDLSPASEDKRWISLAIRALWLEPLAAQAPQTPRVERCHLG